MGAFHFFGEIFEKAFGDVGGGHSQAASAGGFHDFANVVHFGFPSFGVGLLGNVGVETLGESLGSDAAGEALAATLVRKEGHGVVGDLDHVAGVVEDHDSAGPEEGAVERMQGSSRVISSRT